MEMKVWLDGYQRVVCGVTEQTTCQDIMIALAQASGKTGRFTMIEKWRTNERCLSPTDFPLLVLQKWGEYSNDVQLILCHSRVGSGKTHRHHPNLVPPRPESSPPDRIPVKKSLTFNGALRRASSGEQPTVSNGRVVCHSVESSEQGSVASQSSASLSPYMSLERQTQKAEGNLSNGDFEKDFRMRQIWSPDTHLRQGSDEGATFGKPSTDGNPSRAAVPSQNPVPVVPRSQVPVPSVRSSKASTGNLEVGSQLIPKPAQRKEALTVEPKQQNGSIVFETKGFHSNSAAFRNPQFVSDSSVSSKISDVFNSSKAPTSPRSSVSSNFSSDGSQNVSSRAPFARDKNDNIVSDARPKVLPYKMPADKEPYLSRPSELQNGKDKTNQPGPGIGRERPVAARRHRGPVADDSEDVVMPLRTDYFPSSNVTHGVSAAVTSRPTLKQGPSSTLTSSVETPVTSKQTATKSTISTVATSFGATVASRSALKPVPSSTVSPSVEATVTSKPVVKHGQSSIAAPSVETTVAPRPAVKPAPISTVEASVTSRSTPKGPALEDPAEQLREAKEKKELIELIGRQEREMLICESILRDLNSEISALEGDLEVDVDPLETQMQIRKIEEMETVEKRLEEELMELELVSWEDKLDLEKQKENRIRTEITLLQSNIAKSETEIHSNVAKIQSLTIKTEKATKELNRCLEAKKEKEEKIIIEVGDLESRLLQATKKSEASKSALESLEDEILAADLNLSKRKEELEEVEGQLKRLNLENFVQESREIASTRRSRTPVLEMLGLSRPGSSRRRCHLSPSPLRLNRSIDETDQRPELGYVV